jgi:hypothetical protein
MVAEQSSHSYGRFLSPNSLRIHTDDSSSSADTEARSGLKVDGVAGVHELMNPRDHGSGRIDELEPYPGAQLARHRVAADPAHLGEQQRGLRVAREEELDLEPSAHLERQVRGDEDPAIGDISVSPAKKLWSLTT